MRIGHGECWDWKICESCAGCAPLDRQAVLPKVPAGTSLVSVRSGLLEQGANRTGWSPRRLESVEGGGGKHFG